MKARQFPTEVVLSISTGRLLCEFDAMHECVEFLAGGSVFTHQFASKAFAEHLKVSVIGQQPRVNAPEVQTAVTELIALLKIQKDNVNRITSAPVSKNAVNTLIRDWLTKSIYPLMGEQLELVTVGVSGDLARESFTEPLKGKKVIFVKTD